MDQGFNSSNLEANSPRKTNSGLVITIIVLVILCFCCLAIVVGGVWLWYNGDALLGVSAHLAGLVA